LDPYVLQRLAHAELMIECGIVMASDMQDG